MQQLLDAIAASPIVQSSNVALDNHELAEMLDCAEWIAEHRMRMRLTGKAETLRDIQFTNRGLVPT